MSATAATDDSSTATEAGAILGTPGYIAPELIRGEPIDTRADVYALGCILFEILTNESLLPRGREALIAALDPFNTRPSTRAPDRDVPPELDEACVAATSTAREGRPTARGLAEQIERYLDGDRDLALRKTLASTHLEAARKALAGGDSASERAAAMREAGRAIALDPQNAGAAELVGRLMLEPPREVPPEVDARVRSIEEEASRDKAKMMTRSILAFLIVPPVAFVIGVRSYAALAVFVAIVLVNIVSTNWLARRQQAPSRRIVLISAVVFAMIVVVLARTFSPFLLAPPIAAISVLLFGVDPRMPWRITTTLYVASVLVPWGLEFAGWIPRTMDAIGGDLVLHPIMVNVTLVGAELGLVIYVVATLTAAGYLAHQIGMRQREAMRSVELQAWHLRQLVKV